MRGKKKNILIIMSDEQRADTLGCYGNKVAVTPAIDSLAERGTVFENCFTPFPLCCPARASMWTSTFPHRHHVFGNWFAINLELANGDIIRRFEEAGYHTIYTGKWHVPGTTPIKTGFRDVAAIPAVINGQDRGRYIEEYRNYAASKGYNLVPGNIENLTYKDVENITQPGKAPCATSEIPLEHYLETWQTERFLELLERRPHEKPFFAVCSYNAPHFPMVVPAPYDSIISPDAIQLPPNFCKGVEGKPHAAYSKRYYIKTKDLDEKEWRRLIAHYWGFCSLVDAQVGKILDYLRCEGELENTIIIYTSDHGDMMGAHSLNEKGHEMHYDETLRVPLIMVDPDHEGGQRVSSLVTLMDILPTLCELAEIEFAVERSVDGVSFAGLLQQNSTDEIRQYILTESFLIGGKGGGNGEYIHPSTIDFAKDEFNCCIRTEDEKYIFHSHDRDEYYNLKEDPWENINLISKQEMQEKIKNLRIRLLDALESADCFLIEELRKRLQL